MVLGHPHADATYRIVPRGRAYGVEFSIPNSNPTMVTSFATEQDAQRWIAEHKRRATSTPTLSKRPKLIKSGGDAAGHIIGPHFQATPFHFPGQTGPYPRSPTSPASSFLTDQRSSLFRPAPHPHPQASR